jgi:hypothetical protein
MDRIIFISKKCFFNFKDINKNQLKNIKQY